MSPQVMNSRSTISEYNHFNPHEIQLQSQKRFYNEIIQNNNIDELPISYRSFCKLFYDIDINLSSLNDNTKYILNNKQYEITPYLSNNKQYEISLNTKTPIMQFITDIYFQCVFQNNLTINQFMETNFLGLIPKHSKPYQIIRKHLTDYLKYIHTPINTKHITNTNDNNDDDDDEECIEQSIYLNNNAEGLIRHDMNRILYYISSIHKNMFILNKICQIDVVFIPQSVHNINGKYFENKGIKYKQLSLFDIPIDSNKYNNFLLMLRHFNELLHTESTDKRNKRCVILIMSNSNSIYMDNVFIFQPIQNDILPQEISEYTEIPFIINSKNDSILPDLSVDEYNGLRFSIHRHNNNIERVYFNYKSYGMRVFKHNLKELIKPFCNEQSYVRLHFDWNKEIISKEFNDPEYYAFIQTYFNNFQLVSTPSLSYYFTINNYNNKSTKWSMELYKYMINDINKSFNISMDYMYKPSIYQQYKHINNIINQYYTYNGYKLNKLFMNYIHKNEFVDYAVHEYFDNNIHPLQCPITTFDPTFPINTQIFNIKTIKQKQMFIFYFIQYCYLYGTVPKVEYMMNKCQQQSDDNLPGQYTFTYTPTEQ